MFKLFDRFSKHNPASQDQPDIKLIMGLGNPDQKHALTYHNVGQLYVDSILGAPYKKYRNFEFSKKNDLVIAKSTTFMNQSGQAVREALKYFDLKPHNLLLVHDDSDIPVGEYKFSFNRGTAGHNGVRSVIDHLKTQEFTRLRIGIGQTRTTKAHDLVLQPISKRDLSVLNDTFLRIRIDQLHPH